MNIREIIDYTVPQPCTSERCGLDKNGHGTFVAGILSSSNEDCLGIAPDAEIYILKLFTDDVTLPTQVGSLTLLILLWTIILILLTCQLRVKTPRTNHL